jgi:porin
MKTHSISVALLLASTLAAMAQGLPSSASPVKTQQNWNPYTALCSAGVSFPAYYTGEVLGNPTGGYRQGAIYDGVLEAGVQIDLGKLANWQGAMFTADAFYPHGTSLTREDVHDLNVVSNIDSFHNPRLYELWLQQDLFDGKLSIRAGQIPADTEFFLTCYGALFVNSAFGAIPTISMNMDAPVYPTATPGVRLRFKPDDNWSFLAGVFNGNTGDLNGSDRYGTRFNFNTDNGALWLAEVNYTLNPPAPTDNKTTAPTSRPLSGTYKLGGFLNTADFDDNRTGCTLHGDYGIYALADQELWHEPGNPDQGLRGFARVGYTPPDRNTVDFDFETGLNYLGLLPGRDKDLAGFGFVYTKVSNSILDDAGMAPARHYESIVELTYQMVVNDHLTVQPDAQYIFNPGSAAEPLSNALVLGVRFNLTF